ncbi:Serine/threonine protein kinase PrkC, regulator of stationary phase [Clostridiaceae bacterium JG1575]|nr:Serine/threonine protein kinase PrkC, regulator of stationary phase [Clostridiaceae bacterium JG1575]
MIGKILDKRYQIVEKLGDGGMCHVYKAFDLSLKRFDAIKILREEYAKDPKFVAQFHREANAVAALSHPNIVAVYTDGNDGGLDYIVMEYIKGKTLKELISSRGPLFQDQVLKYSIEIAQGLQMAHQNKIIHRDVKSANILISQDNRVRILDFGIAGTPQATPKPRDGRVIGSAHYFSPEHAKGLETDERSDIYSLGVVMYEMATGRFPFDSSSLETIGHKHIHEPVIEPIKIQRSIHPKLNAIILKALEKQPEDRYQSMRDLITDLRLVKGPRALQFAGAGVGASGDTIEYDVEEVEAPITAKRRVAALEQTEKPRRSYAEELESLEKEEAKEKVKNRGLLAVLLVLVIALVGLGIWGAKYMGFFGKPAPASTPKTMTMINIVGMDEAKARLELSKYQIRLETEAVEAEGPGGVILSAQPQAGEPVTIGGTVRAKVSRRHEEVQIPSFSGMTVTQAEEALKQVGLKRGALKKAYDDFIPNGQIIGSAPSSGEKLEKGAAVDLTVSEGRDPNKVGNMVPELKGLTKEKARKALEQAGLQLGDVSEKEVFDPQMKDVVVSQSVPRGTVVAKDTRVHVEIGRYVKKTKPAPDTTPATQPTTQPSTTPATTPATQPGTQPTTKPATSPEGPFKPGSLVNMDYNEAAAKAKAAGYQVYIFNLYNPDGSVVSQAKRDELIAAGSIDGYITEVDAAGARILVNVMSNVPIE